MRHEDDEVVLTLRGWQAALFYLSIPFAIMGFFHFLDQVEYCHSHPNSAEPFCYVDPDGYTGQYWQ